MGRRAAQVSFDISDFFCVVATRYPAPVFYRSQISGEISGIHTFLWLADFQRHFRKPTSGANRDRSRQRDGPHCSYYQGALWRQNGKSGTRVRWAVCTPCHQLQRSSCRHANNSSPERGREEARVSGMDSSRDACLHSARAAGCGAPHRVSAIAAVRPGRFGTKACLLYTSPSPRD